LRGLISLNTKWRFNALQYPTVEYIANLQCIAEPRVALLQIMPTLYGAPDLVYYDNCVANLYAALRRQCTATPGPCVNYLNRFSDFFNNVIMVEIRDILNEFHYSYDVWYNHLTAAQQDSMDSLDLDNLFVRYVNIFCKAEKQLCENGELPKNRAISAMCEEHKYVMGPVVYALEQYFKKFKGYGGGKTWDETGKLISLWHECGFTRVIQSDISGMDRSVTQDIKTLIGHSIYREVEQYVHHVNLDVWRIHAYPTTTKISANYYDNDEPKTLGSSMMIGEVFSGSSDTTFFNTVVTVCFQRYVMEVELGLQPDEYDLTAKGDDSAIACSPSLATADIRAAFRRTYYDSKDIKGYHTSYLTSHGCGMVLKFLSISDDLADIDYCSTNCYHCEHCGYRLTRKIDRFFYLTPWSDSIKDLQPQQQLAYMQNLYEANNYWMKGLDLFDPFNNKLNTNTKSNYTLSGKSRKQLVLSKSDAIWYNKMFDANNINRLYILQQKFGKNAAYSMINQDSTPKECCVQAYKAWLFNKLSLQQYHIDVIHNDIEKSEEKVYSPFLLHGFELYDSYKTSLLHT